MKDDQKNGIPAGDQDDDAKDQDDILDDDDDTEADDDESKADDEDKGEGKDGETVPLSVHLKTKEKLRKAREALQSRAALGKVETPESIAALAKKFNVDPEFATELAAIIGNQTKQEVAQMEKTLKDKEVQSAFEKTFDDEIVKKYPSLADKREIFRTLAFTSANRKKTLEQIAVEAYGNLIGADTAESGTDGTDRDGSVNLETIDFGKMTEEQTEKVMKDPKAKAALFKWRDDHGL